jgi:hypothetical protein
MTASHPVDALFALSRTFGRTAASQKLRLLRETASLQRLSEAQIVRLHDTLYFMRAYPDNADVLRAVDSQIDKLRQVVDAYTKGDSRNDALLNTGVPGSCNAYPYSYMVLQRLVRLYPGCADIDWDAFEDESLLLEGLDLAVGRAESRGLEDEYATLKQWLQYAKPGPEHTDLEVVLDLFSRSSLMPAQQVHIYEICEVPVLYRLDAPGSGRCEVRLRTNGIAYQRRPFDRERFNLKPRIARPLKRYGRLSPRAGRKTLDNALRSLCSRNLEIHALIYANPDDVTVADCGRGLQVVLAGMLPEWRSTLESDLFFLIVKNGVPIAYGPASVFQGCCEMGINLFPEFRGGEIRHIYSQLMRTLHNLAAVRYFFLVSYGMGEDNPQALKSGAFWFYRKMGFKASNPEVEALARAEEKIMRSQKGYRSSMRTLRRLSYTDAYLDLSRGRCRPLDFESLSEAATRYIAGRFDGDRDRAARGCTRRLTRILDIDDYAEWTPDERFWMRELGPILCSIPDLESWPVRDRRSLATVIRSKGAPHELAYTRRAAKHTRLAKALHAIASVEEEND